MLWGLQYPAKPQYVYRLAFWCAPFSNPQSAQVFAQLNQHCGRGWAVTITKLDRVKFLIVQPAVPVRLYLSVFFTLLAAGYHVKPLLFKRKV